MNGSTADLMLCGKGLCTNYATRIAEFFSGVLGRVVPQVACDECGGATVRELNQAAEARTLNEENGT